jgi:CBS-domain-containing membrane protein
VKGDPMKVSDAMSVIKETATPATPLIDLWKIMFKRHFNAIPIVDSKKKLVGIVAKDDLLGILFPKYTQFMTDFESATDFDSMEKRIKATGKKLTKDIMKTRVIFTREETPLMRALSRMIVRHVDQLPVLSKNDIVIGILTKGDVFQALFKNQMKTK